MAVPKFKYFHYPILKNCQVSDEMRVTELAEICAKELKLSEEDKREKTGQGRAQKYTNRTYWSVTYLTKAELLKKERPGFYKRTKLGNDLLDDLLKSGRKEIDNKILEKFPGFKKFKEFKEGASPDGGKSKEVEEDLTAEEKIEKSVNEIDELVKSELLERIQQQDPFFFEGLVVDLLKSMGYAGADNLARSTKKSADGGIDGVLFQDKLGLNVVYVQAKRYKEDNLVQGKEMRDFVGSLDVKGSGNGIFITTSDFSNKAKKTSEDSSKRIIMINGAELTKHMLQFNVGVKDEKVLRLKRIDEDYFTDI